MKSRVASFLALTILAPAAWTQLFFDDELLWLRPLDFLDPDFASKAPIDAYTFDGAIPKDTRDFPGYAPIDVFGSIIFYADGMTILNVGQTSASQEAGYPDFSGRLHQVGLYKANDGTAALANNGFQMYFDGAEQSPTTGWSLRDDISNFKPNPNSFTGTRNNDEFIHFRGPNGNKPLVIPDDEIATFVFWFDPAKLASGDQYTFSDVDLLNDDGMPPDLAFRWQGLEPEEFFGGEDSYTAVARLQPYGGVIPVPEPATYLGASVLLLFIAGHFLHMRRRKKKAAK